MSPLWATFWGQIPPPKTGPSEGTATVDLHFVVPVFRGGIRPPFLGRLQFFSFRTPLYCVRAFDAEAKDRVHVWAVYSLVLAQNIRELGNLNK